MAAEQQPAASWGADTDGRLNQSSEHLTEHAMLSTDASGNTVLVGADGNAIDAIGRSVVAAATGITATDTASVLAAFAAAGNGGVVVFQPEQVYSIEQNFTSLITPRLIIGNGSTLKLPASVSTTTTANYVQGTDTSITVTDSTIFNVGDLVVISDGAGKYTYAKAVTGKPDSTTLTIAAALSAAGAAGTIASGAVVLTDVSCLTLRILADNRPCEITGLTFDGNSSNRLVGRQWNNQPLVYVSAYGSAFENSPLWIHDCTFQNAPCDALQITDVMAAKVSHNHFYNINGMGVHPGGSGLMKDYICDGNSFIDVQLLTAASTPTGANYGHISGSGVICTSTGPGRAVIVNNVVDTSRSYGFDSINTSYHVDTIISNNVFYACDKGAWRVTSSGPVSITGNAVSNCGHETPVISGAQEITTVASTATAKITLSGNVFSQSCCAVYQDANEIAITGNSFNFVTKPLNAVETGGLIMTRSSGGDTSITVSGNNFRGPKNASESTAVGNAVMPCIRAGTLTGINFSGNVFTGGLYGIDIQPASSSICRGVSINGNVFVDQFSTTACGPIRWTGTTHSIYSSSISNNVLSLINSGTQKWDGINITASGLAGKAFSIVANTIVTEVSPAGGTSGITLTGATSGVSVLGNDISLNNAASGAAISAGSATATCVITNNIVRNSNTAAYGSAVVTSGNNAV